MCKEWQVMPQDCRSAVNPGTKVKGSFDKVGAMNKGEMLEYLAGIKELPHSTHRASKRLLAARLPICVHQEEGVS